VEVSLGADCFGRGRGPDNRNPRRWDRTCHRNPRHATPPATGAARAISDVRRGADTSPPHPRLRLSRNKLPSQVSQGSRRGRPPPSLGDRGRGPTTAALLALRARPGIPKAERPDALLVTSIEFSVGVTLGEVLGRNFGAGLSLALPPREYRRRPQALAHMLRSYCDGWVKRRRSARGSGSRCQVEVRATSRTRGSRCIRSREIGRVTPSTTCSSCKFA
jgi:hypothetical protein